MAIKELCILHSGLCLSAFLQEYCDAESSTALCSQIELQRQDRSLFGHFMLITTIRGRISNTTIVIYTPIPCMHTNTYTCFGWRLVHWGFVVWERRASSVIGVQLVAQWVRVSSCCSLLFCAIVWRSSGLGHDIPAAWGWGGVMFAL